MKKIILSLLAVATIVSCNKVGNNEFEIEGNASGFKDGRNVYLKMQDTVTNSLVNLDTVKIENGKFIFKGAVTEPSLHFIAIDSTENQIPFILEEGNITVAVNKDGGESSIEAGALVLCDKGICGID